MAENTLETLEDIQYELEIINVDIAALASMLDDQLTRVEQLVKRFKEAESDG